MVIIRESQCHLVVYVAMDACLSKAKYGCVKGTVDAQTGRGMTITIIKGLQRQHVTNQSR